MKWANYLCYLLQAVALRLWALSLKVCLVMSLKLGNRSTILRWRERLVTTIISCDYKLKSIKAAILSLLVLLAVFWPFLGCSRCQQSRSFVAFGPKPPSSLVQGQSMVQEPTKSSSASSVGQAKVKKSRLVPATLLSSPPLWSTRLLSDFTSVRVEEGK